MDNFSDRVALATRLDPSVYERRIALLLGLGMVGVKLPPASR